MLEKVITTKQELIKLLQSSNIRKIIASDVHKESEINELAKSAKQILRSNSQVTIFVIST